MNDIFLSIAGPCNINRTGLKRRTDRVQTRHKFFGFTKQFHDVTPHSRHDAHVGHHIRGIGNFNTDMSNRRPKRTHAERNDIHGSSFHTTGEKLIESLFHLFGSNPVIRRSCILATETADIGSVLNPCNITRVRTTQIAVRTFLFGKFDEGAALHHQPTEGIVLFLRTIAPVN